MMLIFSNVKKLNSTISRNLFLHLILLAIIKHFLKHFLKLALNIPIAVNLQFLPRILLRFLSFTTIQNLPNRCKISTQCPNYRF